MRPLRSRHSSAASSSYLEKENVTVSKDLMVNVKKDGKRSVEESINEYKDIVNDEMEEILDVEDENDKDDLNENKRYQKDTKIIQRESEETEETMSTMTCLSCPECSQPLGWVEKERYVSRMV